MTDERLAALAARRSTRDRHPARSARVLVAGVSVSALASLVSAFTVQAAANTVPSSGGSIDPIDAVDTSSTTVTPPTLPAPAAPPVVRQVVDVNVVSPPAETVAPVDETTTGGGSGTRPSRDRQTSGGGGGTSGGTSGGTGGGGGSSGGSRGSR